MGNVKGITNLYVEGGNAFVTKFGIIYFVVLFSSFLNLNFFRSEIDILK